MDEPGWVHLTSVDALTVVGTLPVLTVESDMCKCVDLCIVGGTGLGWCDVLIAFYSWCGFKSESVLIAAR